MTVTVLGGGLAGSEAAWALAERGLAVTLVEMRPVVRTPAHQTDRLAELVCSNTFKSVELTNAHGLLKAELRLLGSLLLPCADEARVPGGSALAVDRDVFAAAVARADRAVIRASPWSARKWPSCPRPGIVATGPLTSDALGEAIAARLGTGSLAFYDAIAPIVAAESLDRDRLYRAVALRQGRGRRLPQRADVAGGVRGVHRRARRGRPVHGARVRRRCRTSRGACRSRRWPRAGARRSASAR